MALWGVNSNGPRHNGNTWCKSETVVGPSEEELLTMSEEKWWSIRHDFSCANTDIVITGADRFLIAYSNFEHLDVKGRQCKAIKVQEAVVRVK